MSPTEEQSRLVYATDPREMPVRHPRTHFVIHSLSTAVHLAALGVLVEPTLEGRWKAPIAAKRDAIRYERTFQAMKAGAVRREQAEGADHVSA